jgi:phage replication O-like protein O
MREANPQLEDGYARIANELLEAFARTRLNSQETKIIFAILRKTYGFSKKEDWIAGSQLEELTGIKRTHCVNTKTRLINRNIITQTGTKIRLNKMYNTWKGVPKQVHVPKQVSSSTQTGTLLVPKQVHTKDNLTKDNIQQQGEVFKHLVRWLSSMEDVKYPEGFARKYFETYSEESIEKALANPQCISRKKFTYLCSKGASFKSEPLWSPPI